VTFETLTHAVGIVVPVQEMVRLVMTFPGLPLDPVSTRAREGISVGLRLHLQLHLPSGAFHLYTAL